MNINNNIYLVLIIVILVQFSWYYVTLPGSKLSPNKKHPKPSIKLALTSYLTFAVPLFVGLYYLSTKDKNCALANAYIGLICKK
jgi:hypothetical protein